MRFGTVLIASICAALPGLPAHAQLSPGYSGYSSAPAEGTEEEYWYLIRQLGYCLSSTKSEQSVAILSTAPGSKEEREAWNRLFTQRRRNPCMQNFVSATIVRGQVRGSIAEALYIRATDDQVTQRPPTLAAPDAISDIHDFADCYVASHYLDASRLLRETRVATKGELQFLKEIAGSFGPCLPSGSEVVLDPVDIRFAIAEALYRTTQGTRTTAMTEGGQ